MKPSSRVPQDSAGRPAFYHTIGGVGHGFHQHEVRPLVLGQDGEGHQCWVLPSENAIFGVINHENEESMDFGAHGVHCFSATPKFRKKEKTKWSENVSMCLIHLFAMLMTV